MKMIRRMAALALVMLTTRITLSALRDARIRMSAEIAPIADLVERLVDEVVRDASERRERVFEMVLAAAATARIRNVRYLRIAVDAAMPSTVPSAVLSVLGSVVRQARRGNPRAGLRFHGAPLKRQYAGA